MFFLQKTRNLEDLIKDKTISQILNRHSENKVQNIISLTPGHEEKIRTA